MMYHTAAYFVSNAGVNAVNTDLNAAVDTVFTQRNNHLTMTVPMKLGKALIGGASVTRGRFQAPTWNAIGEFDIFNANRSATIPANPQWDDWLAMSPPIPLNEEFQVQTSNNLGAATEEEFALLQLLTGDWSPQLPQGIMPIMVQMTFTVTPTVNAWSGSQTLALVSNLRNGVYAVIGGYCQGANAAAWRLIFPTQKPYMGRFLRPGGPMQNAIGDVTNQQRTPWATDLGELGRFHTFELPSAEVFGLTAGSITYRLFLLCVYLGTDLSLLTGWAASGSGQSTM